MSGRKHSPDYKFKIVSAAIKEDKAMTEFCQQDDFHKSVIRR